jgi:hypothetical protein
VNCNKHLGGNAAEYERYMIAKYGQEAVDDLKVISWASIKWTCEELAEKKIQFLEMERKLKASMT